jgi:hypothetical protein
MIRRGSNRCRSDLHHWCSHCSDRKVAAHFQAEIVSLQAEFLNIALDESGKKGVELIVVELHD